MRLNVQGAGFGEAPMANGKMESPQRCWSGTRNWLGGRRDRGTGALHMIAHMCRLRLLAKIASGKGSGCQNKKKKWRRYRLQATYVCTRNNMCDVCPAVWKPLGLRILPLLRRHGLLAALQARPYVSFYIQCGVNKQTATTKATSLVLGTSSLFALSILFYYYWACWFWARGFRLWPMPEVPFKPHIGEWPIKLMELPINSWVAGKLNLFLWASAWFMLCCPDDWCVSS